MTVAGGRWGGQRRAAVGSGMRPFSFFVFGVVLPEGLDHHPSRQDSLVVLM